MCGTESSSSAGSELRVEIRAERPVMTGASFLFKGRADPGRDGLGVSYRIRVRQIDRAGHDLLPLVRDCPAPAEPWEFRLAERVRFGAAKIEICFESSSSKSRPRVLKVFEFPVAFWPPGRGPWLRRGIAKYLGLVRYYVLHRIPLVFVGSLVRGIRLGGTFWFARAVRPLLFRYLRIAERKFIRAAATSGPRLAWRESLGPVERVQVWSSVKDRLGCLGHFFHRNPNRIEFDRFPKVDEVSDLPGLAVVTPSMNQSRFLAETMDSVLDCGAPRLAYVVMDGGSSDGSVDLIRERQAGLCYWESGPDGGQAAAIRAGFSKTDGEPDDVMAYLNSDDFYCPGAVKFVLRYLASHPDVDVVYGNRIVVDEASREIGRWVLPPHDEEVFRLVDFIPQETVFWRRRIYDAVGGIDPNFQFALDWDLLLRFQTAGAKIVRLPWFLAAFRVHPEQKTETAISEAGAEEMRLLRVRENGGKDPLPERIWDAVRQSQVESWWYAERLSEGERI